MCSGLFMFFIHFLLCRENRRKQKEISGKLGGKNKENEEKIGKIVYDKSKKTIYICDDS